MKINSLKNFLLVPVVLTALVGCIASSDDSSDDDDSDAGCSVNGEVSTLITLPQIVYTEVPETSASNDTGADAQLIESNSIVTGSVAYGSDYEDTYMLSVNEGDKLSFILSNVAGGSARTIFLYFYNDSVFGGATSVGGVESSDPAKRFEYTVPAGMDNLYVWVQAYDGSGAYTLTVTTPQEPVTIENVVVPDECKANLQGSISDAIDVGVTISDATIYLRKGTDVKTGLADETVNVDAEGNYSFTGVEAGSYTAEVVSDGYFSVYENIKLAAKKTTEKKFSLSQTLEEGQIRLVLSWGANPKDLDSYLQSTGSSAGNFTVSYVTKSATGVILDRDSTYGYGPETITISTHNGGTYTYWISDWSNRSNASSTALGASGASVSVYTYEGLFAQYKVPSGTGNRWNVLTISPTGDITPVNTLGN